MTPTPIYNAVILEVERRRQQVGISMDRMSELMGTAERSYAKMLYPHTSSGRCATWPTLQAAIQVLFPDGMRLRIDSDPDAQPLTTEGTKRLIQREAAHWDGKKLRDVMAHRGGIGGKVRALRLSEQRRKAIAAHAAASRWSKAKLAYHAKHSENHPQVAESAQEIAQIG